MAYENTLVSVTLEAGGDLSAGLYHFVVVASDGQVDLVAAAGGEADGVLQNEPALAGRAAAVAIAGISKVVVGVGGITAGQKVQSDAAGEAILAATGDHVLGKALETGVAGAIVPVLLTGHHILA